jgi:hypothetical protein
MAFDPNAYLASKTSQSTSSGFDPNSYLSKKTGNIPLIPSTVPESDYGKAIQKGASESLTIGLLPRLAAKGLNKELYTGVKDYEPTTTGEKTVKFLTENLADVPAFLGIEALTGGFGGPAALAEKQAIKMALEKGAQTVGKTASKAAIERVGEAGIKKYIDKQATEGLKGLTKQAAKEGAVLMGGFEAVRSPASQLLDKSNVDVGQTIKDVALATAGGAVINPALQLGIRGLGYPVRAIGRKLSEGDIDVKAVQKIAEKAATKAATERQVDRIMAGLSKTEEKIAPELNRLDDRLSTQREVYQVNKENEAIKLARQEAKLSKQIENKTNKFLEKVKKTETRIQEKGIENLPEYKVKTEKLPTWRELFQGKFDPHNKSDIQFARDNDIPLKGKLWKPKNPTGERTGRGIDVEIQSITGGFGDGFGDGLPGLQRYTPDEIGYLLKKNAPVSELATAKNIPVNTREIPLPEQHIEMMKGEFGKKLEPLYNKLDETRQQLELLKPSNAEAPLIRNKEIGKIKTEVRRTEKRLMELEGRKKYFIQKALEIPEVKARYEANPNIPVIEHLRAHIESAPKRWAVGKTSIMSERAPLTTKAAAAEYESRLFRDMLKEKGLLPEPKKLSFLSKTLSGMHKFDLFERKFGVKLGHVPEKVAWAENNAKEILDTTLHQVAEIRKLHNIEGSRLSDVIEGKGLPASSIEQEAATKVSTLLENMYKTAQKNGIDMGHLDQYLPHRLIRGLPELRGMNYIPERFRGLPKEKLAAFQKSRTGGMPAELTERDAYKLVTRYSEELGKKIVEKNTLPDMTKAIVQLRSMGQKEAAKQVEDTLNRFLGRDKVGTAKAIMDDFIGNDGKWDIKGILEATNVQNKEPVADKILRNVKELMYKAWITSNWGVIIKQGMQPELVGAAEIGLPSVLRGRKLLAQKGGIYKAALERNKMFISGPKLNVLEEKIAQGLSPEHAKESPVMKIINFIGKPGEWAFSKLEQDVNRPVMFLGAKDKMMREGLQGPIMDTLTQSQKRMVMEEFQKGGIDAASDIFGRIISDRTNFLYSFIDKPTYLQGDIGELIPFTTWTRNTWSRLIEDVSKGNDKAVIKRMTYAYAMLKTFELATGYQLKGADPYSTQQMAQISRLPVLPAIASPLEKIAQGKYKQAGQAALGTLGATGSYLEKAMRISKDKNPGEKTLDTIFQLKKVGKK